jgi:dTDP-4-amino-4,6-dideoxygalactose transaminase
LASDLEIKLKNYLGLNHLLFVTNGTVALQMAIKALDLRGEIITTPFSFIATTSSIVWEGASPVFVDVDEQTLNIDVTKIERSINENTCAILATHVYGNPCDVEEIHKIAKKHNLKVIYDGAHAFDVKIHDKSIFSFGDISTCSLHATKLYHSIEGGLVVTQDSELLKRLAHIRNFGFNGPEAFNELGLNGKNSEFHAAMGLANLENIEAILLSRKNQSLQYNKWLDRPDIGKVEINKNASYNFAYYPVIFESEAILLKVKTDLEANRIFPRRYFYPSLNTVEIYKSENKMPVSETISKRILCLPVYHQLSNEEIDFVCRIILRALNN